MIRRKRSRPRAHKDADVLARFAETHATDEVERWCRGPVWHQVCDGWHGGDRLHIHHIFHASKRCDVWFNLLRVSAKAHHYLHREPVGGTVACMAAKLHRESLSIGLFNALDGADVDECHDAAFERRQAIRDDWRLAFGRDAVDDLQAKLDGGRVPEWYLDMANGVLEMF